MTKTQFLRGRAPACLAACLTLLAVLFPAAGKCGAAASSRLVQQESEQLAHGQKIEREWRGEAPRFYRLRVAAGQYLNLSFGVLEGKVWLKLALLAPDGTRTKGHDRYYVGQSFDPAVPAFITIAPVAGDYLLEVSVVTKKDFAALPDDATASGRYVLVVNDLRPAMEQDRVRVEAWHTFWPAHLTYQQGTAESQVASKDLYLRSIVLFRQLGDARRELEATYLLANIHSSLGEYESAVEASRQAIALARAAGERAREANALMYLAESLAYLNDYARVIETLRQALPLWQSLGKENSWGVGWALNALARSHRALGERRQAAEYGEQALKTYMAVDYNPREHHRGTGSAAANLGAVYGELGETQKAIERFNLGLEYWQKTGESLGEGRVRYLLGEFYLSLGDLSAAADNLRQALDKWCISGDPNGVANVLHGLGNVSLRRGDYAAAARYLDEALALRVKHKQPRGQAEALALFGRLHAVTGATAKALDYYHQALTLWREVGGRDGEAAVLTYLGEAHAKLGDQRMAETKLQESLRLHRAIGSPAGEAQALYLLGRVRRDLGRTDTARADIEAAIEIAESLRASVVSAELRASYLASVRDYYEFYIDLLMRERGPQAAASVRAALHINERASARSLLESLRESRADIRQGVDAALLASERELQQLLNGKSAYQVRLLSGKHTPAQAAAAAASINEIVGQLRDTRARIKSASPRYAALTQPQPLTAEQMQRELLDEETLLLEYSLGEERSFLWAVTPATLTSYELPSRAEIEAQAVRVYDLLTARNRRARGETPQQYKQRAARADAELTPQAAALSRLLLGPVAHQLGRKRLLVVAPGKLQFVPFGALPEPAVATGKRKDTGRASRMKPRHNRPSFVPLLVNHEIVSLPSASTLAALRRETLGSLPI